jgi:UDP-2,3-diacylglucosamine hydrolase
MIYFISDLHLEEGRPDITGAFLYFMDKIQSQAEALYILGDFFESWIGDDEDTELQVLIKERLRAFSQTGKKLYFMHGNRDFLVGELFAVQTGAQLLEDPCVVNLNGIDTLLMHGDSLCTADTGYMKFRATIRNPAFLEPFLKRPLEERKITAQQLRAMSQANNQSKDMEIMDVTLEEIPKVLRQHNVTTLIHGHTHRPAIHALSYDSQDAQRIVLGDWDKEIWYLAIDDTGKQSLKNIPFPTDTRAEK